MNHNRAIVYLAWGKKYVQQVVHSISSSIELGLPIILITDHKNSITGIDLSSLDRVIFASFEQAGLMRKSELWKFLPEEFDSYLFLDTDTVVLKDVGLGFEKAEMYGIAMVQAPHYSLNEFFGFDRVMVAAGVPLKGQLQYNTGVIFFRLNKIVIDVFMRWEDLSKRYGHIVKNDQPFLSLAMEQARFNPYTLSPSYNHRGFGEFIVDEVRIWHSELSCPRNINQFTHSWPPRRIECGRVTEVQFQEVVPAALFKDGVNDWAQGQIDQSVEKFRRVLDFQPSNSEALNYLGVGLAKQKKYTEAIKFLEKAVQSQPDLAEAWKNLGALHGILGNFARSLECLQQAVNIRPDFAEAHYNLGVTYEKLSRLDEATASYKRVLRLQPNHAGAYNNLGIVFLKKKELETAWDYFQRTLRINPKFAQAHYYLASIEKIRGRIEQARQQLEQAIALKPGQILWRLERDLLCPDIMPNRPAIDRWRQRLEEALAQYQPGSIDIEHWLPQLYGQSNVYPPLELAYHVRNDRLVREKLANLFKPPPAVPYSPKTGDRKKHLGFLATRGHERGLMLFWAGLIDHLSPEFEVTVIGPAESEAHIRQSLSRSDVSYLGLTSNVAADVGRIRVAGLDLLYFWEVGTDAENYLLPFFRLAPVQCTSWVNATTTGIAQIDYFISNTLIEPPQAEHHYSETLVKLDTMGFYFQRPAKQTRPRRYFDFDEKEHLYLCVQNLKKFHPDFDPLLGEILRQDRTGTLLLKAKEPHLNQALLSRFKQTIPDVVERIKWIPPLSYHDYLGLVDVADVVLDTLHYSGGTTSFECLAIGTPIVTWPGHYARGRMTFGCYQKIGALDCVAHSPQEYVDIAVRLGTNRQYRNQIKQKILTNNHSLYRDVETVRELEQFFRQAIENASINGG